MGLHPHSGIATVTVFTQGDVRFDDPQAGEGTIGYGGVDGCGPAAVSGTARSVGGRSVARSRLSALVGVATRVENAPAESQYIEAESMKSVGPAHVIVGTYQGVTSPVCVSAGLNYLLVTLRPGETWSYQPPPGHTVGWLAIAQGRLDAREAPLSAGEISCSSSPRHPWF